MQEVFRVYAHRNGEWEVAQRYDQPEDYIVARDFADDLIRRGQHDQALVLERAAPESGRKDQFDVRYRAKISERPEVQAPSKPIELSYSDGLQGGWVKVPQKYSRQHEYYGVSGWLAIPIVQMAITFFGSVYVGVLYVLAGEPNGIGLIILGSATGLFPLYLLFKRRASFQTWYVITAFFAMLTAFAAADVFGILWQIFWIVYVIVSRRVNVTCQSRVRREDLDKIIPKRLLETAKFVREY